MFEDFHQFVKIISRKKFQNTPSAKVCSKNMESQQPVNIFIVTKSKIHSKFIHLQKYSQFLIRKTSTNTDKISKPRKSFPAKFSEIRLLRKVFHEKISEIRLKISSIVTANVVSAQISYHEHFGGKDFCGKKCSRIFINSRKYFSRQFYRNLPAAKIFSIHARAREFDHRFLHIFA